MFPFYKMSSDSILARKDKENIYLARKEKEKYRINQFKPELS